MAGKTHDDVLAGEAAAAHDEAQAGVIVPAQTFPPDRGQASRVGLVPTLGTLSPERLEQLLAPATMDYSTWLEALLTDERLEDSDPDEAGIGILAAILLAETSEQALAALNLKRAKELCGGEPGGHSPLLEIRGARGMVSSFEEGAPAYAIVQAVIVSTGERIQFTTGARAVQAVILKHIGEGWLPFRAILTIRLHPTRRGFHPLNLEAGG
jgi:hypothetical protein